MSKHSRCWNETKYEKFLKEGRGKGEGPEYLPWIKIYDFSSKGTISRVLGWKSKRVHHFMSNNELMFFYQLEWSDNVLDIREQFPLSDLSETTSIARNIGVKHPVDHESGYPYVLTTDFLITTKKAVYARTVKTSKELQNKRVIEKLEVERRYWQNKGVDWKIVTEAEIRWQRARNVEWIHNSLKLFNDSELVKYALNDIADFYGETKESVCSICTEIDGYYNFVAGTALSLFKYLVANKKIQINMDERINITHPREKCFGEVLVV